MVECELPKLEARVRFPSPAPLQNKPVSLGRSVRAAPDPARVAGPGDSGEARDDRPANGMRAAARFVNPHEISPGHHAGPTSWRPRPPLCRMASACRAPDQKPVLTLFPWPDLRLPPIPPGRPGQSRWTPGAPGCVSFGSDANAPPRPGGGPTLPVGSRAGSVDSRLENCPGKAVDHSWTSRIRILKARSDDPENPIPLRKFPRDGHPPPALRTFRWRSVHRKGRSSRVLPPPGNSSGAPPR